MFNKNHIIAFDAVENIATVKCGHCKKQFEIKNLTQAQLEEWQNGGLVQNVFPNHDSTERELLTSGTCERCWDEIFGEE